MDRAEVMDKAVVMDKEMVVDVLEQAVVVAVRV